jgi:hypothetical protein
MKKMKMKFLLSAILFTSILALTSCIDDFDEPGDFSTGAKSMNELKVSSDFKWSTAQAIEITITGLPVLQGVAPSKATLLLKGEKDVYYTGFHAINENLNLKVSVPSTEKSINLKFGSIEQAVSIQNDKVSFSYIPVVPNEE